MKHLLTIFALWALLTTSAHAGNLTAEVDSTHINRNETLTLSIQYDEQTRTTPDTTDLEKDFNIRRQGRSSNISLVNGNMTSTTTWQYEISPKRTGQLLIPSFAIDNDFSDAIAITVDDKSTSTTQTDAPLYTETQLDRSKAYVQQQVIVTWRLISRAGAPEVRFTRQPQVSGAMMQDIGNRTYQRAGANGRSEWVIEQRYALFPQQSGSITIPAQTFQAVVTTPRQHSSGFFLSTPSAVDLETDAKQLEVMPAIDNGKNWLPATTLNIQQQTTGLNQQAQATAGTAFTRTIQIRAQGLTAEQLPSPDIPINGAKIYSEKPVFNNKANSEGNIGTREDRAAIIATQAGTLLLPAVHIAWYDTQAEQWREAVLPEKTIEVLPNPNADANTNANTNAPTDASTAHTPTTATVENSAPTPSATTPATATSTTIETPAVNNQENLRLWQIGCAALLLILLALFMYTVQLRRNMQKQTTAQTTQQPTDNSTTTLLHKNNTLDDQSLQQTIARSDWHNLYQTLQQWAHTAERQAALQQPPIAATWRVLETHLYGKGPAPTAETAQLMVEQITAWATDHGSLKKSNSGKAQLDSLYW